MRPTRARPQAAPAAAQGGSREDAELVHAARTGEVAAQRALFMRYAATVHRLAFVVLGRDDEVDDLVQEVFVEAISSLHRLREPAAFEGWLRRLTVYTGWAFVRRRRLRERLGLRRGEPADIDSFLSPHATPDTIAELRSIFRAVDRMPPGLRIPLVLRRVEGLELEEIAAMTGCSLATVKRRLGKAEELLRQEEGPWGRS